MRARGLDPFPHLTLPHRILIADLIASSSGTPPRARPPDFQVAGRIIARRKRASTTNFELRDRSGTIPLCVRNRISPDDPATRDVLAWDIGDIVCVTGHIEVRDGKMGLDVHVGQLLTKAMQVHHGLSQDGHRVRRPELRLMSNVEHRERLTNRARLLFAMRHWLNQHHFVEVETPVLQASAGGAVARPFLTHHNALDQQMSLRISTQLYLRRCIVGDLERVYEIAKCFRNEGMSLKHSPEFTMLEWSMAYSDYRDSASLAECLITDAVVQVLRRSRFPFNGVSIDLTRPWHRLTLRDVIKDCLNVDIYEVTHDALLQVLPSRLAEPTSWSETVHALYSTCVEPFLIQPTIVYDFPIETNPCTKRHPTDGRLGESFDIVIGGLEIGSGGSELNDPDEQRQRFAEQNDEDVDGLQQPHALDRDYVAALNYGAPPSSGVGIGVDRLMTILFDVRSIADTSLFSANPTTASASTAVRTRITDDSDDERSLAGGMINPGSP